MNTTLVIMAAGMGSRFGGLKQAQAVTDDGKGILDFSVFDAKKAGFDKVVFIIRKDVEEEFKELIGNRIAKTIDVDYVIQDTSVLPEGRTKPFGTGHAILCCKDVVKTPAMVAYQMGNTLSKNGTVTRGVCSLSKDGYLQSIEEVQKIDSTGHCVYQGKEGTLPATTPVSMNLWGLTTDIFDILEEEYAKFLKTADLMKDEFYIPLVIGDAVKNGKATVKAYINKDVWHGITYREDLPEVKEAIAGYVKAGLYEGL